MVSDVYFDTIYGQSVVIDHGNGIFAYYSALHKEVIVSKGDVVKANTPLGAIDVVPCEISDPPHVHLAMKKDNIWVSPLKTMGMSR